VSSETIASQSPPASVVERCAACNAPLADDQRYCLECGERRFPMSSVLTGGPGAGAASLPGAAGAPPTARGAASADGAGRGNAVTVIAGVGVLLLAMGVGVLIGRSGSSKPSAAPAQVISVASTPATGAPAAASASFTSDWPAGTNGYTVVLQTLPVSGTQASAVEAAKSAASAKGAKGVGALKAEEFTSLKADAGMFVIYSGVYHGKGEAEKALKGLKKNFSGATVVKVSNGGGSSSSSSTGSSSGSSSVGASESHPAPPSVVESLKTTPKGKSYEEKSKNLPNVISTG
jgi:hypothetical protein